MFSWLRELLDIRYEHQERKTNLRNATIKNNEICDSCETLKTQLEIAHATNRRLMDKLLEPKEKMEVIQGPPQIIPPKTIPWRQKQQMLEAEDREKARALRASAQPDPEEIKNFEKELDNAKAERENQQQH